MIVIAVTAIPPANAIAISDFVALFMEIPAQLSVSRLLRKTNFDKLIRDLAEELAVCASVRDALSRGNSTIMGAFCLT